MKSLDSLLRIAAVCTLCSAAWTAARDIRDKDDAAAIDVTQSGDVAPEILLIAEIYRAAAFDEAAVTDAKVKSGSVKLEKAVSVTMARRAATACAWLRNDGDHGRAAAVAGRTVQQLASWQEANDAERVERLYWEAWLLGECLENKPKALRLVNRAEKLAPADPRWPQLRSLWAGTVAEKGE